jgi:hypothetical protein
LKFTFSTQSVKEEEFSKKNFNQINLETRLETRYAINVRIPNKIRKLIINNTITDEIITTNNPIPLTEREKKKIFD